MDRRPLAEAERLAEVEKMQRVPGIVFADGPTVRRARVAGTGLEVFEIIATYRWDSENWDNLKEAFHWLSEAQLRAALTYAETYPEEINAFVEALESFSLEEVWEKHPYMKPQQ